MKIEEIDIYAQLNGAGIDIERLKMRMAGDRAKSQHFQYHIIGGNQDEVEIINLESTAKDVMEELTRLPVDYQQRIFYQLAMLLKEPGAQIVVIGDGKKRGGRIVRLASDDQNTHNLLLTN